MAQLFSNISNLNWQQAVMWLIGGILIYLAVKRDMEPALLLPMGFGAILVNLPLSGAVTQAIDGVEEIGVLNVLFDAGIANELFVRHAGGAHRRRHAHRRRQFRAAANARRESLCRQPGDDRKNMKIKQ